MVRMARLRGPHHAARGSLSAARRCAYRVIRRVREHGAFADRAFVAEAARASLDARDRAFAQQLVYGTVQRRATLDYVLTALSARPVDRIDPPLRDALQLGVYQVVYLGGVPDHAAVEQTVELAKLERGSGHRFANAVMRRAAREARGLVDELTAESPAEAAVLHSHPEWVVRLWWDLLGPEETLALLATNNTAPESAVRANELIVTPAELRDALEQQGVRVRPVPELAEALVLEDPFDAHGSRLFDAGALMPQSRSSMLVTGVLDPQPGDSVLDLCAAPGAKTTHIAARMRGRGRLVAVERNRDRSDALERNCARMGAPWVEVRCGDARDAPASDETFDRVLLDAPCSDLGTLQARPDVRWRKRPEQVEEIGAEQQALLESAAERVRPGGTLVYSTCTISPVENEERVRDFLAHRPDFSADDLVTEHGRFEHPRVPRFLQVLPHRDGSDGFFIARLRRAEAA
jgi:16S rRNA (cytosine967-C5)-methyltransferase